jgi:hypothetical protein
MTPIGLFFVVLGIGGLIVADGTRQLCETACTRLPLWPFVIPIGIGAAIGILDYLLGGNASENDDADDDVHRPENNPRAHH